MEQGKSIPEVNEYDVQAQAFLDKTGTVFTAQFVKHGIHFEDDKEPRDIYECTLLRNGRSYTCMFGQSLAHSGEYIVKDYGKVFRFQDRKEATKWVWSNDSSVSAININPDFQKVRAYDLLATVQKYDPGTFKNFCDDFGYNTRPVTDYEKVLKIYNAVREEYFKLAAMFSEEEMQELQEIS